MPMHTTGACRSPSPRLHYKPPALTFSVLVAASFIFHLNAWFLNKASLGHNSEPGFGIKFSLYSILTDNRIYVNNPIIS